MKKFIIISMLMLLTSISSYSQMIGFITAKEGYDSALELVKQNFADVKLIAIFTGNKEITLPMGGVTLTGEIKFEGEDIGKSNFWSYIFYDTVTQTRIEIISVKVIPMGGAIMSMEAEVFINTDETGFISSYPGADIAEVVDSDMFIKKVAENKTLNIPENPDDCHPYIVPSSKPLTITVCMITLEYLETIWKYKFSCGTTHEICEAVAINVEQPHCSYFESILENDFIEISIIPNPATDEITIKTDENIDKIDISYLDGKLINTYTSNNNNDNINISNYATGIYFIKFYINNRIIVKTFIKE